MRIWRKISEQGSFLYRSLGKSRNNGIILCYHRVLPRELINGYGPNTGLITTTDNFEQQMRHLSLFCNSITLDQMLDFAYGTKKRPVVVTFDDGSADNLIYALPILEKYQIPATVYVTTGYVLQELHPWWLLLWRILTKKNHFTLACEKLQWNTSNQRAKIQCFKQIHRLILSGDADLYRNIISELKEYDMAIDPRDRFLTPNEVARMSNHPLITIGLHTHTHTPTRFLNDENFNEEMEVSSKHLKCWTGRVCTHFAYPYGSRLLVCNRLKTNNKYSIRSASTTDIGFMNQEEPYGLSRLSIPYGMHNIHYKAIMGF